MHKVAAIMQVKNESSLIAHQLDVLSLLVDRVVVFDDNSDDDTVAIIGRHPFNGKITVLKNTSNKRNEGKGYQKCLEIIRSEGYTRMYIADADEIVAPYGLAKMKELLFESDISFNMPFAQLAMDQSSVYGTNDGGGKMIISNIEGVSFDTGPMIHTCQPPVPYERKLVDSNDCAVLHYGCSDGVYQIFKCICYVVWDHQAYGKKIDDGYVEYFKTYRNFVEHGDEALDKYLWKGEYGIRSPVPYRHWLPEEVVVLLSNIDPLQDFDIHEIIRKLEKNRWAQKNVFRRSGHSMIREIKKALRLLKKGLSA